MRHEEDMEDDQSSSRPCGEEPWRPEATSDLSCPAPSVTSIPDPPQVTAAFSAVFLVHGSISALRILCETFWMKTFRELYFQVFPKNRREWREGVYDAGLTTDGK